MIQYLNAKQQSELLDRLIARTTDQTQLWRPYKGEYEFRTQGKKFFYYIACRDEDDAPPFTFEIWRVNPGEDGEGDEAPLLEILWTGESSIDGKLTELYRVAKNRALNIDGVSADLLADLD